MTPVHEGNELSPKAVETLMEVTRANYPLAQRYYRWKAKELGMEKLTSCDLIAPLPGEEPAPIEFDEAKEMVLDAFGRFHHSFKEIAEAFFTEERIDAPPRPGKSGGAFCMGVAPDLPVYVLTNYTGKLRDVATLAHELGHGIHFVLASKQPLLEYSPVLPVAETASVFGELLLTKKLLDRDLDDTTRKHLVAEKVEDIIATTFRQTMYTDFELDAHLKIADEQLDHQEFCDLWAARLNELYGDSVDVLDASLLSWSAIPHFIHTRFYCYAYTFGELLVLALYRRYQEEGDAFAPKLIKILETGGAASPGEMLAELDYNLEDPEFWRGGYQVLEEMLEELGA
jgi:oligoendopeptidase F